MSERAKKILGGIALLLFTLIIAILLFLFFFSEPSEEGGADVVDVTPTEGTTLPSGDLTTSSTYTPIVTDLEPAPGDTEPEPPPPPDDRSHVERIAAAFVERFGSFSNTSNFENVLELKPFMTTTMAAWADGYVEDAREEAPPSTIHFGVTTRSLVPEVTEYDDDAGTATVVVQTQRMEDSGGSLEMRVYYQSMTLEFERVNDVWKVDSAEWGEEMQEL